MLTADEVAPRAVPFQGIGQRQATHDVASPNLQRSVGTERYRLRHCSISGESNGYGSTSL